MNKQRKYDWPELFKAFDTSGLSQTAFCAQHNINPKYFSQKRKQLKTLSPSAFEKVSVQSIESPSSNLMIQVGRCNIHCPENMPLQSFVSLVHHLA